MQIYSPDTTRASFGPQVWNPQVILAEQFLLATDMRACFTVLAMLPSLA